MQIEDEEVTDRNRAIEVDKNSRRSSRINRPIDELGTRGFPEDRNRKIFHRNCQCINLRSNPIISLPSNNPPVPRLYSQ